MRDFSVLSDIEFEQLAADLMAAEMAVSVERFAAGQDRGIDLRWHSGKGIAQCKHYPRSTFAHLKAAAQAEVSKVEELAPQDYRFITSFDLSVGQKDQLFKLFEKWMTSIDSVIGGRDFDGLLTLHEQVERRHPKLWLSTGTQLFWTLHADLANRVEALKDRISRSLPRYVMNRGYMRASSCLTKHRVCLIAGVPGIGKTMLAQILVADAMTRGYEPVEVSEDIAEAWNALRVDRRQIFLYDDFLGQISFSERLGKNEDKRLADFVEKVSTSRNKLLVMTTREYILQDALRIYERLDQLDRSLHFILELEDYTRADRARILYNHLWHSDLSPGALGEIARGGYRGIVDHPGYSPRLVEYCTGPAFDTQNPGYVQRFVGSLDHPERLWRTAFEDHLNLGQQLLLVVLATLPVEVGIEELLAAHRNLCVSTQVPMNGGMARAALAVTEGTFIAIGRAAGRPVIRFHNPSIAEFMLDLLSIDRDLLRDVVISAKYFEQIRTLYSHSTAVDGRPPRLGNSLSAVREEFVERVCSTFHDPTPELWRGVQDGEESDRIEARGIYEGRLTFCWSLREPFRPASEWLYMKTDERVERWKIQAGGKNQAIGLYNALAREPQNASLCAAMRPVLESWLASTLHETKDWTTYLRWVDQTDSDEHLEDSELAQRFGEHAAREIARWHPTPPYLDDLMAYAIRFGLEDLKEGLDEVAAAATDAEEAVGLPGKTGRGESLDELLTGRDDALDRMFSRLAKDS